MRFILTLFTIIFIQNLKAQNIVTGKVIDAKTKDPLAFASIQILHSTKGVTTDIDGKFTLKNIEQKNSISVSYLGYKSKIVKLVNEFIVIELEANIKQLDDVVIDGKINPAHRVLDSFLNYKKQNNPFNYKTFQYNSYTKAGIAADEYLWIKMEIDDRKDSLEQVEKLKKQKINYQKIDTSKFRNFKPKTPKQDSLDKLEEMRDSLLEDGLRKNYFLFTESYTKRYYKAPGRNKETVLATKVTGFDNPNFAVTSNSFQPMGMYDDFLLMIGKSFQSPLTKGCKNDYRFVLKDIITNNNDTTFIISFRPKRNKNFLGLKGVIHINSNNWALENIIAEPAKDSATLSTFKLQQKFGLVNGKWFPKQLNTIINKKDSKTDSSLMHWDSKSYFANIEINNEIPNNTFDDVVLDYVEDAGTVKDSSWEKLRVDTLTKKDKGTYETYKLMPDEVKKVFNKIPKIIETIALGVIPWGKFEVPFTDLIRINQFESVRLGVGLRTSSLFSKNFQIGGNIAYGFRDAALKYGGFMQYQFSKKYSTRLKLSYRQDVEEPGMVNYFSANNFSFANNNFRKFLVSRMDSVREFKASFTTKPFHNMQFDGWFSNQLRNESRSNYAFKIKENFVQQFTNTEIGVGLKYTIGETYTMIGKAKVIKTMAITQVFVQASKGLPNLLNGDLDYNKLAFQINHRYKARKLGETKFFLYGGQVFGNVPSSYLFNNIASQNDGREKFFIYTPNQLQTVRLYEFLNDRMLQFTWEQDFGGLLFSTKSNVFKPQISLVNNVSYGWLQNKNLHQNINYKTLQDGVFETGLVINDIYKKNSDDLYYLGYGLSVFYRYGANSLQQFKDNISVRLTTSISF